jgi:hypothetical protein
MTGVRAVPLQPMQVVHGDQNGYPVPGGLAGPPCTVGYKYGGLVLQVWGMGGRLTTCRHKKAN